jgi:hypothetical protein
LAIEALDTGSSSVSSAAICAANPGIGTNAVAKDGAVRSTGRRDRGRAPRASFSVPSAPALQPIDQTSAYPRVGSPVRRISGRLGLPVRSRARRQQFAGRLGRCDPVDRRDRCNTIDGPDRDRQGGMCRVRLATPVFLGSIQHRQPRRFVKKDEPASAPPALIVFGRLGSRPATFP